MKNLEGNLELSRRAKLLPIEGVAGFLGIPSTALIRYGDTKAKLAMSYLKGLPQKPRGKLILVTAISPTPAGEGKTTTTIGLGDALRRLGKKATVCLREPSMGPCFGLKGGATGGGRSQIAPMEDINLHFTGDFHAVTSANNLLSALIDNHIYWGNVLGIDPSKIVWRRALDMNDRSLRNIVVALGGNGQVREDHFDITVATEVMAILCLSRSLKDLESRLEKIIVGRSYSKKPITAAALKAAPAMTALLKDALMPNLVQTLEHTPAFVHGGPFANIAHGCNSVLATTTALQLSDYVVTEAGFGADLGAEKFFNIKCRQAGLVPSVAVLVATIRALKMHGGLLKDQLKVEDCAALERGLPNLLRHIENLKKFGLPVVVAINHFSTDTDKEISIVQEACRDVGVNAHTCRHFAEGGEGAEKLAGEVCQIVASNQATFKLLYSDDMSPTKKIETIAKEIYRADSVELSAEATRKLSLYQEEGYGKLPICVAKTQYSFSSDPSLLGAPDNFVFQVRDVFLSAGAGFIGALGGGVLTMPGLPKIPAAERIGIDDQGLIEGLN